MNVAVAACTTPLGISALNGQSADYKTPPMDQIWSGAQYAEEYLIPIAKSDLIVDGIHINSPVIEVGRVRYYREEVGHWQDRANDEFRLVVASRDRGVYTARADIILDCRGTFADTEGYGPGGAQTANAAAVQEQLHTWLPGDPRFENRMLDGKLTIVFGNTERAVRFVEEWAKLLKAGLDDSDKVMTGKLTWLVPSSRSDSQSIEAIDGDRWRRAMASATSVIPTRGVEKIDFVESTKTWKLQISHDDDSTTEIVGEVFAPFTNALPTTSIGPTLYCDRPALTAGLLFTDSNSEGSFYPSWAGWKHATGEPNYYRLGAKEFPFDARGLAEGFQQIKEVFALLGAREALDLYGILRKQNR